ncbi:MULTISPECIES: hypothetical protein [Jannaschia]|uniref:hypothetical protein n=1 Tax=Jannaschia TaxID=188905 RepID=UPI001C7CBB50|nr:MULTISPECIES: hypothetical protein [unclassified Jannaschia]
MKPGIIEVTAVSDRNARLRQLVAVEVVLRCRLSAQDREMPLDSIPLLTAVYTTAL